MSIQKNRPLYLHTVHAGSLLKRNHPVQMETISKPISISTLSCKVEVYEAVIMKAKTYSLIAAEETKPTQMDVRFILLNICECHPK